MSKWLRYVVVGLLSTGLMCTGSALAWADGEIMLDLVRHGQSTANAAGIIDTVPPGTDLDAAGVHQADEIAALIQGEYGSSIANVVASEEARAVQTAAPLADLLHISNPVD
ncbi:MAG: phosphoglycerate mutase family protein, partial [Mycobacterium sp.]